MKEELIKYLKTKDINHIDRLWSETKHYYNSRSVIMGGSYASFGADISVRLKNDVRFTVSLEEVKNGKYKV